MSLVWRNSTDKRPIFLFFFAKNREFVTCLSYSGLYGSQDRSLHDTPKTFHPNKPKLFGIFTKILKCAIKSAEVPSRVCTFTTSTHRQVLKRFVMSHIGFKYPAQLCHTLHWVPSNLINLPRKDQFNP